MTATLKEPRVKRGMPKNVQREGHPVKTTRKKSDLVAALMKRHTTKAPLALPKCLKS